MSKFRTLINLLIPSQCALCQRGGWTLCETCLDQLELDSHLANRADLRGYSITKYAEPVSALLSHFKERGVTEISDRLVSRFDSTALSKMLEATDVPALAQVSSATANLLQPTYLVPVPSSKASMRVRGFNPAEQVAKSLRAQLAGSADLRVARVLTRRLEVADQASLNLSSRWQNQTGSMAVRHSVAGMRCLLVDDIVTTGATLLEARKTLVEQGASVVGFFTLAETFLNRATQK